MVKTICEVVKSSPSRHRGIIRCCLHTSGGLIDKQIGDADDVHVVTYIQHIDLIKTRRHRRQPVGVGNTWPFQVDFLEFMQNLVDAVLILIR